MVKRSSVDEASLLADIAAERRALDASHLMERQVAGTCAAPNCRGGCGDCYCRLGRLAASCI